MTTPTFDPMDDVSPEQCSQIGLSCGECTQETARHLAAVCKVLRGKAVGQLFVQLYPSSSCAPMHAQFAAYYQDASRAALELEVRPRESFERREVGSMPRRASAAVA